MSPGPLSVSWLARPERAVPADDGWLCPAEIEHAAGLVVPARLAGWRLRRWTAKAALGELLGPVLGPLSDVEIANRAGGAPEARRAGRPLGVALSLTDRAGWAACVVAPGGLAVGCDLERIEPRSAVFVADWFTPAEQDIVARSAAPALAANLVWSAKESALKVIGEGLRRPTRSVEVRADPSAQVQPGGFVPLTVGLAEGGELTGWWRRLGSFVFTVATAVPAPAPPAFLSGPVPD